MAFAFCAAQCDQKQSVPQQTVPTTTPSAATSGTTVSPTPGGTTQPVEGAKEAPVSSAKKNAEPPAPVQQGGAPNQNEVDAIKAAQEKRRAKQKEGG